MVIRLFQQILTLFIMIGCGFSLVRLKLLKSTDSKVLSVLSVYLIMPCVSLNAFQIDYTPEILEGFLMALGISLFLHVLFFFICIFLEKVLHMTEVERLSVIYPNAGNLIVPLVAALFGEEWIIYSSAYCSVQIFWQWTHANSVMGRQKGINLKKIFTNVNLICVFIGLFLFLAKIQFPFVIGTVTKNLASMIGPVSMLMIGMMIGGIKLSGMFTNKRIYFVAFMRLIAIPIVGIFVLKLAGMLFDFQSEETILTIILLAFLTPVSATTTQLSQLHNNEPEYCSAINVMTTLLCIVTMPLMLSVYRWIA